MKQQNSFLPQDLLYQQALAAHESELIRVAAGYERDPAKRPDLLQDHPLSHMAQHGSI